MSWVDLLRHEKPVIRLYEGQIATEPETVNDKVEVVIRAFDQNLLWGPAPWQPRVDDGGDTILPVEGDRCVVALAETEDPGTPEIWVLEFWPYGA